jgi:hypothetical protein
VSHTLAPRERWDVGAILLGTGGTLHLELEYPAEVTPIPRVAIVRDAEGRVAQWVMVERVEARSRPLAPGSYRVELGMERESAAPTSEFTVAAGQETLVRIDVERP